MRNEKQRRKKWAAKFNQPNCRYVENLVLRKLLLVKLQNSTAWYIRWYVIQTIIRNISSCSYVYKRIFNLGLTNNLSLTKTRYVYLLQPEENFWNQNKRMSERNEPCSFIHKQICVWSQLFCIVYDKNHVTEFESEILFREKILSQSIEWNGQMITVKVPVGTTMFLFVITYDIDPKFACFLYG